MVEILCTAFSYKELYKNYQKVVDNPLFRVICLFTDGQSLETLDKKDEMCYNVYENKN